MIAGVLLLVFSFSITPKKLLHDAIANHKDKTALAATGDATQLSHTGFTCKCDDLVAESLFTADIAHFDFAAPICYSVQTGAALYHFYSSPYFFFELRGPPATVATI